MTRALVLALMTLVLASCAQTLVSGRDVDLDALRGRFADLRNDPRLGGLASAEEARADEALRRLAPDRGGASAERAHQLTVAEAYVELAYAAAHRLAAVRELLDLERERDRILLEAARRDADEARREAERLRMQNLARAEEAQRARADAAQAEEFRQAMEREAELARREAEAARRLADAQSREASLARREADLAVAAADSLRRQLETLSARREDRGMVLTLGDVVFESGRADLKPEVLGSLDAVLEFLAQYPNRQARVEGHTDSTGDRNMNQVLSQRRADAVRDALVARGVDSDRLLSVGLGPDFPVAGNETPEGRARNRRVDIVIEDD